MNLYQAFRIGEMPVIAAASSMGKSIYSKESLILAFIALAHVDGISRKELEPHIKQLTLESSKELIEDLFSDKYCHMKQWVDRIRQD